MVLYICKNFIIISEMVFNLQSRHMYIVEMAMFTVQRVITPQVGKPELRFMSSASCLIVLYICVKFRENIEQTQLHSRNGSFQYLLCLKDCNSKSRLTRVMIFLYSACGLMMLYICEKFHNNISNFYQLKKRT